MKEKQLDLVNYLLFMLPFIASNSLHTFPDSRTDFHRFLSSCSSGSFNIFVLSKALVAGPHKGFKQDRTDVKHE